MRPATFFVSVGLAVVSGYFAGQGNVFLAVTFGLTCVLGMLYHIGVLLTAILEKK